MVFSLWLISSIIHGVSNACKENLIFAGEKLKNLKPGVATKGGGIPYIVL
jgi:hypothetical protein